MISTVENLNHTLQASLESKHKETLDGLSTIKLWQKELSFFQTLLDGAAKYFDSPEDKKKISRFQNLFLYYHAELLIAFRAKLRNHELHLADIMRNLNASDSPYYTEHTQLMTELEGFSKQFAGLKDEFFKFIERIK